MDRNNDKTKSLKVLTAGESKNSFDQKSELTRADPVKTSIIGCGPSYLASPEITPRSAGICLNLLNSDLMKLKQLESHLSKIKAFEKPKIEYEQYPTSAHIASHMMFAAQDSFEDLEDQTVLDLGVGCGILSIASGLMGASYNMGIDIDPDALEQTRRNADSFDLDLDLMRMDANNLVSLKDTGSCSLPRLKADTVIMNPPFGTKTQKGVDLVFLQAASLMAEHSVYSLHKTSTRDVSDCLSREF